jgi:hypothetical protein
LWLIISHPVCLNPQITLYSWPNSMLYLLRHWQFSFTGQILWIRDEHEQEWGNLILWSDFSIFTLLRGAGVAQSV